MLERYTECAILELQSLSTIVMVHVLDAHDVNQQSRKLAAINSSKAISGYIGNSGISVLLLV